MMHGSRDTQQQDQQAVVARPSASLGSHKCRPVGDRVAEFKHATSDQTMQFRKDEQENTLVEGAGPLPAEYTSTPATPAVHSCLAPNHFQSVAQRNTGNAD